MRRLLSIDGGGIKGIIPAAILAHIEQLTGKLIRDVFSFVGGTSTGAVITAAVAAGIPAQTIVEMYLNHSKDIFTPGAPWNVLKRVVTGSMYDPRKLKKLMEVVLGPAKDWRLNDCPIDVLLTAKKVSDGVPWYFVKDRPQNAGTTGNLKLIDCAVASAAAPTYFTPWAVEGLDGDFIDGGVGVTGNPVYQAVVEAFYYTADYNPEETVVLSLGTGWSVHGGKPTGLLGWLEWTLDELLESPEEQQTEIVKRMYPAMPLQRIDIELKEAVEMDDASALPKLYELVKTMIASLPPMRCLQQS